MKKDCNIMKKNKFQFLREELSQKENSYAFSKYHVIPIPLEKSVTYGKGTRNGPSAILKASNQLERLCNKSEPCKNGIFTHEKINCKTNICNILNSIKNIAYEISKTKKIPIAIGGEHTLTFGMIEGIKNSLGISREEIGIIQIDAHADLRYNYQNNKYSHASVMFNLAEKKYKIFQIGVRAISQEERKNRDRFSIKFIDNEVLKDSIDYSKIILPSDFPKRVYISFDADGLDPSIMPATGTPVPRGISYENSFEILKNLTKNKQIIGFDYVEFSPIKNIPAYDYISANIVYELMEVIELNSN